MNYPYPCFNCSMKSNVNPEYIQDDYLIRLECPKCKSKTFPVKINPLTQLTKDNGKLYFFSCHAKSSLIHSWNARQEERKNIYLNQRDR